MKASARLGCLAGTPMEAPITSPSGGLCWTQSFIGFSFFGFEKRGERVELLGPEPAMIGDPSLSFGQSLRLDADQVLAPGDSTFDQPCPLEHTYMFGYGVQRQAMAARKIGDARLPCPRELSEYAAARLVTEGKEGFV
jgi:hypothetical protein